MKLVMSVWNEFPSTAHFDAEIPLAFFAARMKRLGIDEPLHVPVLRGFSRLDPAYVAERTAEGIVFHDCEAQTERWEARLPRIVEAYSTWGGIRHYATFRFLVMAELFPGERILFCDSDIVFNATPADFEPMRDATFILARSPCFGHIADPAWWTAYRTGVELLQDAPEAFVARYSPDTPLEDFLNPRKVGGSDQAIIRSLIRAGEMPDDPQRFYSPHAPLILFPNWLQLGNAHKGWEYARHDGIDTLNGKKVAVSHLSNDFASYLAFWYWLRHLTGVDDFGPLPAPFYGMNSGLSTQGLFSERNKVVLYQMIRAMYLKRARDPSAAPAGIDDNPFVRRNIIEYFYGDADFSGPFLDGSWWDPETFAVAAGAPEIDRTPRIAPAHAPARDPGPPDVAANPAPAEAAPEAGSPAVTTPIPAPAPQSGEVLRRHVVTFDETFEHPAFHGLERRPGDDLPFRWMGRAAECRLGVDAGPGRIARISAVLVHVIDDAALNALTIRCDGHTATETTVDRQPDGTIVKSATFGSPGPAAGSATITLRCEEIRDMAAHGDARRLSVALARLIVDIRPA